MQLYVSSKMATSLHHCVAVRACFMPHMRSTALWLRAFHLGMQLQLALTPGCTMLCCCHCCTLLSLLLLSLLHPAANVTAVGVCGQTRHRQLQH
jgi:hypothetical protein